ncbi:hypothetical protein VAPA_2c11940 [Variovorax paradoxus B4]|uniref:Uncharacterized protein n=1 Tax=Variovorax paradoxus B4 TaxID=1246301 RepID=T1XMC0_VARPD|nr:hypothetical protein VAPA_2c11940 [Variovorax paradoxus B4]
MLGASFQFRTEAPKRHRGRTLKASLLQSNMTLSPFSRTTPLNAFAFE